MITWNDCFNDSQPDLIHYQWQDDLSKYGFKMCFICGAIIFEKRDWLHVDFHNYLLEGIKKDVN